MEPVQTSIDAAPALGLAGDWVTTEEPKMVKTGMCEVALTAGRVCVDGTIAGQVKPPVTAASLLSRNVIKGGVVLFQHRASFDDAALYDVDDAVNVVQKGPVWMYTETALTAGTHPFVRFVAAGAEVLGTLRNDADTSDAVRVPWLRVRETVTGAGLVAVDVTLPHPDLVAEYNPANDQVLKYDSTTGTFGPEADAT